MADIITADDLQVYVGGQFVRDDRGMRQFQGPIQKISGREDGKVEITCAWLAEHDPKTRKSVIRADYPVTHTLDLWRGCNIWNDLKVGEFFQNPHVCTNARTEEDPCRDPEHLAHTYHMYRLGSSMEKRVRADGPKRFLSQRGLAALGFTVAGVVIAVGVVEGRRRRKKGKRSEQGRDL